MAETLQTLSHAHFELETVIDFVKFNIYIFSCSSRNPMIIQIITNNKIITQRNPILCPTHLFAKYTTIIKLLP